MTAIRAIKKRKKDLQFQIQYEQAPLDPESMAPIWIDNLPEDELMFKDD